MRAKPQLIAANVIAIILSVFTPLGFAGTGADEAKLAPGILTHSETVAVLPVSVFFRGQSATIQSRNSAGIRADGGKLILVTLVDSSGYSSAIQQTYQAYLLNEVPLMIGTQTLAPGAYGFGFTAGDHFVVMDIGGNEILHGTTTRDNAMPHPVPLQVLADPSSANHYLLYLGRNYAQLTPVAK
jgi:hypothetical protein